MMDETIAPTLYRTAGVDRTIPFFVAAILLASAPVLAWASASYFFPWGLVVATITAVGAGLSLFRWRKAREVVVWNEKKQRLDFYRGRHLRSLEWSSISKVEVRPSSVQTVLWNGAVRYRFSHRLVGAEALLDKLRAQRPELFVLPEPLVFRRSAVSAVLQTSLAAGTAVAGFLLSEWQVALAVFFFCAAAYVALRILFFIPRHYRIESGTLTSQYWLRKKRWGRPLFLYEESYAAGGVVFFRMVFDYGRAKVALDEEHLVDPLRPASPKITQMMGEPG